MGLIGRTLSQILIVSTYFVANSASAFLGADLKLSIASNGGLVHKTSIIETDDRLTFDAYASRKGISFADTEERFGATGVIMCGASTGTAQLTGNSLVITTAAHVLYDQNCNIPDSKYCFFAIRKNDKEVVRYQIDRASIRTGGCSTPIIESRQDWAVMELKEAVPKVKPYQLLSSNETVGPGQEVTQVTGYSDNFRPDRNKPKSITECNIKDVSGLPDSPMQTNCDTGTGASGSAQLVEIAPGQFRFAAMHTAHRGPENDGMSYDPIHYFNISIPVDGEFRQSINAAMNRAENK